MKVYKNIYSELKEMTNTNIYEYQENAFKTFCVYHKAKFTRSQQKSIKSSAIF